MEISQVNLDLINPFKTLIVDDDVSTRRALCRFMEKFGCPSHVAGNGKQAISLFHHMHPELIMLDFSLPDMMGTDLLKVIKNITSSINVIFVTESHQLKSMVRVRDNRVKGYIEKPIDFDHLYNLLTKIAPKY